MMDKTKSKQKAAKQLGVPAKILVPVENIIKVEDLERELAQMKSENEKLARENAELKKRLNP